MEFIPQMQVPTTMSKKVETAVTSPKAEKASNLFFVVETFDHDGKSIGHRVVDMYHFGTREWLSNHNWWAMHQGHEVSSRTATVEEVNDHIDKAKQALAEKYPSKAAVKAA